ncbi:preprotein translocase subunit SecY [Clostridium sp. 19966]|uniref:preprotein translocase subunit SecY n=1 Tax=Clostridium sp. 19966 TaxID=2768166 RepID=UPI0028DDBC3F|nr:preprotein translocase subunit SecY [Clostridium sp. 19966]MDT8715835.1 preprotein translocase subunit SecY [Clostridium sp. 19966]
MLSTIKNAWKIPELRKRILFTIFLVAVYRLGSHIPVPGIDSTKLAKSLDQTGLVGFYDLISGGAFRRFSIFAMGVIPYINSSIIMQLLTVAIPYLEQLSKEGEEGRKKIQKYTRNVSVVLAALQSYGVYVYIYNYGYVKSDTIFNTFMIILTLTTASTFLMWLGDMITVKGIGNGVSLLIFVNIIAGLPDTAGTINYLRQQNTVTTLNVILFAIGAAALVFFVIIMSLSERRITVQYAGKVAGNKTFQGQSSHIPFNLTSTGVIAIIFAMSVLSFPTTIAKFFPNHAWSIWVQSSKYSPFNDQKWVYPVVYAILVIFFSWFYAEVTFKPEEMAENIYKSSGFIPGIRPGKSTYEYIEKVLFRVAMIGGLFAAVIAIIPVIVNAQTKFQQISFGGTSILIMVGVAMDTVRQLESQLIMRHYHGFLK